MLARQEMDGSVCRAIFRYVPICDAGRMHVVEQSTTYSLSRPMNTYSVAQISLGIGFWLSVDLSLIWPDRETNANANVSSLNVGGAFELVGECRDNFWETSLSPPAIFWRDALVHQVTCPGAGEFLEQ